MDLKFFFTEMASWFWLLTLGLCAGWITRKRWGDPFPVEGRLNYIEGLRALAALGVVATHVTQHVVFRAGYQIQPIHTNLLGGLAVQIFFAITAYLFTRRLIGKSMDPIRFMESRIRRVVPLYLLACVASLVVLPFVHTITEQGLGKTINEIFLIFQFGFVGAKELTINGFNMLQLIGVAWTLHYEWGFYLSIFLLGVFLQSPKRMLLGSLVFFAVAAFYFTQDGKAIWTFFLPGVIAAVYETYAGPPSARIIILARYSIVPLLIITVFVGNAFSLPHLIIATLLFLSIFVSRPKVLECSLLRYLGQISYSIYLLQYLVMVPLVVITFRFPTIIPGPISQILTLSLTMLILVPLSHFTFKFVELPWMRRGQRSPAAAPSTQKY